MRILAEQIKDKLWEMYPNGLRIQHYRHDNRELRILFEIRWVGEIRYTLHAGPDGRPSSISKKKKNRRLTHRSSDWPCCDMTPDELELFDKLDLVLTTYHEHQTGQSISDWV